MMKIQERTGFDLAALKSLLIYSGMLWTSSVQAALIATDSFATQAGGAPSYYDTAINGGSIDNGSAQNPSVGVSGFTGAWDAIGYKTGAVQAQNGVSLTHAMSAGSAMNGSIRGYSVQGGRADLSRRVSRALTSAPTSDGTYYMSILLRKTASSTTGTLWAGLGPSERYDVFITGSTSTFIGLNAGAISFYSNGTITELLASGNVNAEETYLALLQFDYSSAGADSVTVTLYDSASVQQATRTFNNLTLNMSYLHLAICPYYSPEEAIDEFRFGTALSDVVATGTDVVAHDDLYELPAGEITITNAPSVLSNDLLADSAVLVTNVTDGTLSFNADGTFDYTAPGVATNSFWYSAVNATSTSTPAKVTLITTPPLPQIPTDPKKLHVYLLIGQSNMAGRAPYTSEEEGIIDGTFLLNGSDIWEPAEIPLNQYSTIRKELSLQKLNPGYTFAQTMAASNSAVSIGLVVNARGGTSIDLWAKGGTYYNEAIRRAQIAQTNATLKGILWHQGEADRDIPTGYINKLTNLVFNLRNDLGKPNLPFVAGEIHESVSLQINSQINQLPGLVPFSGVAGSAGLSLIDDFHFDNASQKLLGRRYAAEMQRIQTQLNSPPAFSGSIEHGSDSITWGLTNLIPGAMVDILQSPRLSPVNWSTAATFIATAPSTNWVGSAVEPQSFYTAEWR
ncbi:sialate O-acetylesterase [Pontiella desulfatans]|nr:sialate O-acetylesterase [Pontiella desulfatans]